jgi:hypothetical protein
MNNYRSPFLMLLLFISTAAFSQTLNWSNLKKDQKHILNASAGLDYGLNFGVGYNYQLRSKLPILLGAEYSFPAGNDLLDDFKTKVGGQIRLARLDNFYFSARIEGVFRRYNNEKAVRMLNFGSDFAAAVGYYKTKWFVASEAGFDKAIVTHFKHAKSFKESFPSVQDGWFDPSTGGNFNYGLQAGYSFSNSDISIKAGKLLSQDFKSTPFIPFYVKLGYNVRLTK